MYPENIQTLICDDNKWHSNWI